MMSWMLSGSSRTGDDMHNDLGFYNFVMKGIFRDMKRDRLKITRVLFATMICGLIGDFVLVVLGV